MSFVVEKDRKYDLTANKEHSKIQPEEPSLIKPDKEETTLSPLTIYETEVKKEFRLGGTKRCMKLIDLDISPIIPVNKIKVRLGEYDFGTSNENNVSDFNIERFYYPNYDLNNGDNDIGLLKLERPTSFGDYILPVCLSPRFETFENRLGIVIGWGTQQYGGTYSNILREVMIKILKRSECEAAFPGFNPITPNMFCAGLGGGDSCQGDSGGPFLIQEPDLRWYVVGIVSRGIGCGQLNQPGVYTKVNKYLNWIENRILT
ncbi:Vitamin K-dependent protein C [Armadillidium nasatum]|uniref:Vitamin K-dependent protein C n=1 Tax=Armadillidium nasatum TaxID=96803 RepID=A0A5N5T9E0_9CRUS|nr:Vitamin K-dependent protein C [Armadillidium nasatum]